MSKTPALPFLVGAAILTLALVIGAALVERGRGSVAAGPNQASRCGQLPTFRPTLGVPTPALASPDTIAPAAEKTVGIGVWSDCVRPQSVTVQVGQLVQWAAAEEGIAPEVVLDDGTSLGWVRHVLEYRFTRPGTYRYHLRERPDVVGTIVVVAATTRLAQTVAYEPLWLESRREAR